MALPDRLPEPSAPADDPAAGRVRQRGPAAAASTVLPGLLFSMLAYFLFGSSDAVIKVLAQRYAIVQLIALQVGFAMVPLAAMIAKTGGLRRPARENLPLLGLRALLAGVGTWLGVYSFGHLPLADVYALAFCTPFIVTLLAIPLLGEKVGPRRWAAVILGFIGVMVMVRPGFTSVGAGHLAALGTAFTGAGTVLIMRHLRARESAATMVATVMVGLLVVSLPSLPFVWTTPTLADLGLSAAAGLMMGCAQFSMLRALSLASAATVAPMQYSMMVWAMLYGWLIFATPVSPFVVLGAGIVVASSLYTMHRERVVARRDRERRAQAA